MQASINIFAEIVRDLLQAEQEHPVAPHIPVSELYARLDLGLSTTGVGISGMKESLKELVLHSPRTATSAFFNQLFGGRNDLAVLGDLLAVVLNNSMYTYKAAGPMIGIEKVIIRAICDLLGWDNASDGTLAPGGSMTNLMGMLMARDAYDKTIRHRGSRIGLCVYTSDTSHYSTPKNAAFAGIGRDHVRLITSDPRGRMDITALINAIQKDIASGLSPIMVNATAGTTVLGAFDPLNAIADVCQEYGLWMHVDGAYCGACLLSDTYRHLIAGAELSDSFTLNAHKMLGTPLSTSLILVRDKSHLYDSFSNDATYLYQTDNDDHNPGKISLQCGRRNDALKLWTLWKAVGTNGLAAAVDKQFKLADVAREYVRSNSDYILYSFDDSIAICFNYKGISAEKICTALYEHSRLMVGYGSFQGKQFIRLVTINYQNDEEDILKFFAQLEEFVAKHM